MLLPLCQVSNRLNRRPGQSGSDVFRTTRLEPYLLSTMRSSPHVFTYTPSSLMCTSLSLMYMPSRNTTSPWSKQQQRQGYSIRIDKTFLGGCAQYLLPGRQESALKLACHSKAFDGGTWRKWMPRLDVSDARIWKMMFPDIFFRSGMGRDVWFSTTSQVPEGGKQPPTQGRDWKRRERPLSSTPSGIPGQRRLAIVSAWKDDGKPDNPETSTTGRSGGEHEQQQQESRSVAPVPL